MEKRLTLMQSIREAASKLKDGKLKRLNMVAPALHRISAELGFDCDEQAMVFVAILDRQCGCRNSDLDDLSNYFEITSLDVMQFVPAINSLITHGFLTVENRSEALLTRKQFMVCPDVFYAIIEGRKVEPVMVSEKEEYDQFDFCQAVSKLKEDRKNDSIETRKLFICVEKMEAEHAGLALVSQLRSIVKDIESRTLFYEMCKDYSERPDGSAESDINSTLDDIYDRVIQRAKVKKTILNSSNPLIVVGLIRQSGDDEMKLTQKGVRMLFGDNADALIKSGKVEDRYEFVKRVYDIVNNIHRHPSGVEQRGLFSDLRQLEEDNESLSMLAKVRTHIEDEKSRLVFYLVANDLLDGDTYSISSFSDFCGRSEEVRLKQRIKEGEHPLIKRGLLEVTGGGIFDGAQLSLTDKGKEIFLEEDVLLFEAKVESKDLIQPEKIAEKRLFFEDSLQRQLDMLGNSLSENNYASLCQRLGANNLPKGVAVLLYGNPGTGKTESVMQLARATGRAIMHVDISATKTCWFGESEKLIKEVFTKYRRLCEKSKIKPILLFNEADAVFTKRKDSNSSSVAQTENAIQNIILEEMERLDGILIATTNLADNLDKAFERRFLFKIRFDKPTVEAKLNIWRDKIPTLTTDEASQLAVAYDFSGGEIDNIVRKALMSEVIDGKLLSLTELHNLCREEKISKSQSSKVGFTV